MLLTFVIALCSCFISFTCEAKSFQHIKKEGVLSVATEGAFPPFNFVKNGKIQGFEVELVNEMAKRAGLKTDWQTKSFDGLLIGLNQDRYDLVAASHVITPERENVVDFLPPHFCATNVVVTLKNGPTRISEFKGKKIGVQASSIYPKFIESNAKEAILKTFPTDPDVVMALVHHKIDAAITDRLLVNQMLKTHPQIMIGEIAKIEKNGMAIQKGNHELREKLKKALESIQKDGTYQKISQKYFKEDIRCKNPEVQ